MKKVIITLALILTAGSMFAQEIEGKQRWRNFETNRFVDNWELSLGVGIQTFYLMKLSNYDGHDINPQGFGKDITFLPIDITVGKWITPIVGVRGAYTNGALVGHLTNWCADWKGLPGVEAEYKYWSLHADLMINLTNWICQYKPDRMYNAIFFAGAGYSRSKVDRTYTDPEYLVGTKRMAIIFPIGVINRLRLSDSWSLNLELRDQISSPLLLAHNDYREHQLPNKHIFGNLLTITAGATWKFNKVKDFNVYTPIDKEWYDNKISDLEKDLQDANDQNTEYQQQIEKYKQQLSDKERELQEALRKAAEAQNIKMNDDITLSIFFPIGSAEISDKNEINIRYMADIIKASKRSYTITGYADNNTGSEERNLELSQQRAESVYNALIDAGVDSSKLKIDYKGCTVQPFDKDYLNRVAVIN